MVGSERTARDDGAFGGPVECSPDTPVLEGARASAWTFDEPPPRFGDNVWRLPAPESDAAGRHYRISWDDVPPALVEGLKHFARALLNHDTPSGALERSSWLRPRPSDQTVASLVSQLKLFAHWLDERGASDFADVDEPALWAYIAHLRSLGAARDTNYDRAWAVTRLWLHNKYLPIRHQLRQPPWEIPGEPSLSELFGPPEWRPENTTEPIDPDVWALMWSWAEWFIRELGPDIVRAKETRDAMRAGLRERAEPGDGARLREWRAARGRSGEALPGRRSGDRVVAGCEYIALQAGVSLRTVYSDSPRFSGGFPIELGAPIDCRIDGRLNGRPWTEVIDYYEVDHLVQHLATACAIVIVALTGMRGTELRSLTRGCCREIDRGPGRPPGYEVWGKESKVTDAEGNAVRGGKMRDHPWWGIPPVPGAFAMLERLHDADLLLLDRSFRGRTGRAVSSHHLNKCIGKLIAWCNTTARRAGLHRAVIPEDPAGRITVSRFRRTVARSIQRRPYGRIANGVLLGHVSLHTTDGYGTHVYSEQRDTYRQEESLAIAARWQSAIERRDAGEGVSGAAALEYLDKVTEFGGKNFTASQGRALRENPDAALYENDHLFLMCFYRADLALCHPGSGRSPGSNHSPDLTNCQVVCPNVVYTDRTIAGMEEAAQQERATAASPESSLPTVVRSTQRAERMEEIIAKHRETRIVTRRDVT